MKKTNAVLAAILAVIFLAVVAVVVHRRLDAAPQPQPQSAAESGARTVDWKTAYREFYANKGYLADVSDGESTPKIALKDMDLDGTPELLLRDPWNAGTFGNGVVYTLSVSGKVISAGISDSYGGQWWPHAISDSSYPGFYTFFWYRGEETETNEMPMHILYYYLENRTLKHTDVASDAQEPERYDRITDDEGLYNAIMNNDVDETISFTECPEPSAEKWNALCAEYGF